MSYGRYETIEDGLGGSSVAAQVPHEWPLVSSRGLADQVSTASQYNSYMRSFDGMNAVTDIGTDKFLNCCPDPIFGCISCAGTPMRLPGPSNILGTAFTNSCLFDGVPMEFNESRHLLDTISGSGNAPEEEIRERRVPVHKRTCVTDGSQFNPLNVAIRVNSASITQGSNQSDLSNLVVYVTGQRPNVPPSPDTVGFIARFHDDGNTTYLIPPDLPTGRHAQVLDTRHQDLELPVALAGTSFTTPGAVVSGRIYIAQNGLQFSLGPGHLIIPPDPNNPGSLAYTNRNSFIEFTHTGDDVTINLSFVDMVSLALGFNLTFYDGDEQTTISVPGLKPDGLGNVCDGLALLGGFWPNLCVRDKR
ncbi:hypothetical protein F4808DRAFT_465408 [Astrocystis sublimbata]|nr:hypothetical protein F4808DRAFT_465408 [Astrocystis sublimbata]